MNPTRLIAAFPGAALALLALVLRGADPPAPAAAPITLAPVMLQRLPEQVCRARVGPDGRVWFSVTTTEKQPAKAAIAAAFAQPAPVLPASVTPVLFAPDGRVWFQAGADLYGYDGKQFVGIQTTGEHGWRLTCPNHGGHDGDTPSLYCDDTAFFVADHGVYTFDGQRWDFLRLSRTQAPPVRNNLQLFRDAPGKSVLAWLPGSPQGPQRWRQGKWQPVPLPPLPPERIVMLVPWIGEGAVPGLLLTVMFSRYLRQGFIPDDPQVARQGRQQGQPWGVDFADPRPEFKELLALGGYPLKDSAPGDRAQELLAVLAWPELTLAGQKGPFWHVATDASGAVYLWGGPEGPPERRFLLVARPGHEAEVCGPDTVALWHDGFANGAPFLVGEGRAWLANGNLVDFRQRRLVARVPDPTCRWVSAVLPDGAVFLSASAPDFGSHLSLFRPGAPDPRRVLVKQTFPVTATVCWAGPEGQLWAETAAGVAAFDGRQWQPIPALAGKRQCEGVRVGADGLTLVRAARQYVLLGPDGKTEEDEDLLTLVRRSVHRPELARSFRRAVVKDWGLIGDAGDNLWVLDHQAAWLLPPGADVAQRVVGPLDAGRTTRGPPRTTAHYASPTATPVSLLASLAEGKAVYVGLGRELTDGLRFHPAGTSPGKYDRYLPGCELWGRKELPVLDGSGCLWVGSYNELTFPIAENNAAKRLEPRCRPILAEPGGTVWILNCERDREARYEIGYQGAPATRVVVPNAQPHLTILATDRAGSVYAWTPSALFHYLAPAATPAAFALHAEYAIQGPAVHPDSIDQVRVGPGRLLAAIGTDYQAGGASGRQQLLVVVPLPPAE